MNRKITIALIILFLGMIAFVIWLSIKCFQLEAENMKLQIEKDNTIEVVKSENEVLENEILKLQDILVQKEVTIDSLKTIKQEIIIKTKYVKEHVVSSNITEGANKLKENLKWRK